MWYFRLSPNTDFFSSTKFPTLTSSPTAVSGRICAKGPTLTSLPILLSNTTLCLMTVPSPIEQFTISVLGPIIASESQFR